VNYIIEYKEISKEERKRREEEKRRKKERESKLFGNLVIYKRLMQHKVMELKNK
jgi:hypothetical protein